MAKGAAAVIGGRELLPVIPKISAQRVVALRVFALAVNIHLANRTLANAINATQARWTRRQTRPIGLEDVRRRARVVRIRRQHALITDDDLGRVTQGRVRDGLAGRTVPILADATIRDRLTLARVLIKTSVTFTLTATNRRTADRTASAAVGVTDRADPSPARGQLNSTLSVRRTGITTIENGIRRCVTGV